MMHYVDILYRFVTFCVGRYLPHGQIGIGAPFLRMNLIDMVYGQSVNGGLEKTLGGIYFQKRF